MVIKRLMAVWVMASMTIPSISSSLDRYRNLWAMISGLYPLLSYKKPKVSTHYPLRNSLVTAIEKTVVFVGEKQSGKSSLIAKFLDEPVKDDMKETTALDYRYGTRIKEEKKQKVNIYELGKMQYY
jgi:hypothetical protein